jgi:(p)ppGpp synthase/HD superfamily hydrolase
MSEKSRFSVQDAVVLAAHAHAGQVDKLGRDYFEAHLLPIAAELRVHGEYAEMAGLLHDILEDTELTEEDLRERGVPAEVVRAVVSVTKRHGESYADLIERSAADPLGRRVKLADNAHNLAANPALARTDPEQAKRLREKYHRARAVLLGVDEPRPG